jgi:hypothetical protein
VGDAGEGSAGEGLPQNSEENEAQGSQIMLVAHHRRRPSLELRRNPLIDDEPKAPKRRPR